MHLGVMQIMMTPSDNNYSTSNRFPLTVTILINDPDRPGIMEISVGEKDDFRKIFDNIALIWRSQSAMLDKDYLYSHYYFEYLDSEFSPVHLYECDWDQKFCHINRSYWSDLPSLNTICLHSISKSDNQLKHKVDRLVGISIESLIAGSGREVQHFIHTISDYCSMQVAALNSNDCIGKLLRENPSDLLDEYPKELLISRIQIRICFPDTHSLKLKPETFLVYGSTTGNDLCSQAIKLWKQIQAFHHSSSSSLSSSSSSSRYIIRLLSKNQYVTGDMPLVKYAWLYEGGNPWPYANHNRPLECPAMLLEMVGESDGILDEQIYMNLYENDLDDSSSIFSSDSFVANTTTLLPQRDLNKLLNLNLPCPRCPPIVNRRGEKIRSISLPACKENCLNLFISYFEIVGWSKEKRAKHKSILKACIYQADSRLCLPKEMEIHQGPSISFDVGIHELPRSARLCLVVVGEKKNSLPLGWANICLFDFELKLQNIKLELVFWPYEGSELAKDKENDFFKPLGTVMPNNNAENCPKLSCTLCVDTSEKVIYYPSFRECIEIAGKKLQTEESSYEPTEEERSRIEFIMNQSPLYNYKQDYDLLWKYRYSLMLSCTESLPKIVASVNWKDYVEVSKLYSLLQGWPHADTPINVALELLDCKFTDEVVRHFAVIVLSKQLTERQLSLYLPQLVQALKYENYLDSYLAKFLLSKAITNRHFGQALFYHLRCEMLIPSVSIRFGILLAGYLRTCPGRLDTLNKQLHAATRMKMLSEQVRTWMTSLGCKSGGMTAMSLETKKTVNNKFHEELHNMDKYNHLVALVSPLEPDVLLQDLVTTKCRFFDSKMVPLMFMWSIGECCEKERRGIIYKHGDDLRQDILTLQIFNVMQDLWQKYGLSLSLRPYRVIALNDKEGFIELVPNSITLSALQQEMGGMHKESVFNWLLSKQPSAAAANQQTNNQKELPIEVVERFTRSLAAYCIACFVLGVGDRHSDNIMISTDGTFFHIDFGHFLGNFKKFVGIPRENVRFLLMPEFLYVVTNGDTNKDKLAAFDDLCRRGFLTLRKNSNLLITMFLLMANTGIPQLSSPNSLKYLENTLKGTEKDAIENFNKDWNHSKSRYFLVHLDWHVHNERRQKKCEEV